MPMRSATSKTFEEARKLSESLTLIFPIVYLSEEGEREKKDI